ncbi:DMT family transporter [uncultured Rhodoblastus sp.]|uniref:DMT family transporter n=1 Tax=uncultured Rhodoblastus sp. TaxID=543037 RepID=UPI0025DF288D|nr:DMT family transporter [uncultured Rhodoblastus sp.]
MLIAVLLKILSTVAFTAMAIGVRAAASSCPVGEIVFFRSAIALVVLLAWLRISGGFPAHLATTKPLRHLGRGLSGTAGMFANFLALSLLPLADATAYFYVSPIFVTLIAALALRENVLAMRWIAVAIGFCGVLAMLSDHIGFSPDDSQTPQGFGAEGAGALVALSGAAFAALSIIQTRRLAISEHTGAIVFYFTSLAAFFGALLMALAWIWPAGAFGASFLASQAYVAPGAREWLALAGVGVAGGVAQILATLAYRFADASLLASFDYLAMLWALLASLAFFGEWPSDAVLAGAAAIAGSGLLAILGERSARRRQASPA